MAYTDTSLVKQGLEADFCCTHSSTKLAQWPRLKTATTRVTLSLRGHLREKSPPWILSHLTAQPQNQQLAYHQGSLPSLPKQISQQHPIFRLPPTNSRQQTVSSVPC